MSTFTSLQPAVAVAVLAYPHTGRPSYVRVRETDLMFAGGVDRNAIATDVAGVPPPRGVPV